MFTREPYFTRWTPGDLERFVSLTVSSGNKPLSLIIRGCARRGHVVVGRCSKISRS
ncbi:unnamed protein product, partial [Nesidiocoris tenuis]